MYKRQEYAYQTGIHPAVISYLSVRREYFYSLETTVEGKWFATPRGWEDLSRLMDVYEAQGKTCLLYTSRKHISS